MEKSKKIDLSNRPIEQKGWGNPPSCPTWIFADEKSADKDLKRVFSIVE